MLAELASIASRLRPHRLVRDETVERRCYRYFDWSIRMNQAWEAWVTADRDQAVKVLTEARSLPEVVEMAPEALAFIPELHPFMVTWSASMPKGLQKEFLRGVREATANGFLVRYDWLAGELWSLTWINDENLRREKIQALVIRSPWLAG